MLTQEQYKTGMELLHMFMKKINIKINKNQVIIEQVLEFPDEKVAEMFAESYKKTFEEGI